MYKKVYSVVLLLICQVLSLPLWAQAGDTSDTRPVEMADKFRADGKIYVVIVVVLVILLGLILYVARLDRKISKLEQE